MEQVLVLNGLASLVDTRGSGASCAQNGNGTVSCLDTPLGLSAAQAAETGGRTAEYVASRLDVLAQESRAQAAEATVYADELDAASSSAHRIGDHGSAIVAARAAEASRIQSRAALAQSAAAAAAAQAVRVGNAAQARMAGDAVVAAAWKGDTAEVDAGALRGLRATPRTDSLSIKQAVPKELPDVARFTIADPSILRGQIVGTKLLTVGLKAGSTRLELETTSGGRKTYTVTVEELVPTEQIREAVNLFNQAKSIGNAPGVDLDWQDASVLRASYDQLYPSLRKLYLAALTEAAGSDTFRPQRYQALFLMRVLVNAKARPDLATLREVVLTMPSYTDRGTTVNTPTGPVGGWSPSGRECSRNSRTGVVFHDLYVYARDRETLFDIARVTVNVAEWLINLFSSDEDDSGGENSSAASTIKAAASAASEYIPEFAVSPKKIVSGLGNAVCVALAGTAAALPVTARAAVALRAKAIRQARYYRTSLILANDTGRPEEKRAESEALAQLALLDAPRTFTAAQNAELEEAKNIVNADASLEESGGGESASKSGGGGSAAPVVAAGAAAAALALWWYLR